MRKLWRWLTNWLHDPTQARASAFPCGALVMLAIVLLAVLLWGTFQDRLVSELRLAGASTPEEADQVLRAMIVDHNRRFCRQPGDPKSV